jgi:peptidoglycan/xylan/chitin deacetylase (PgdA/CDA1 family)
VFVTTAYVDGGRPFPWGARPTSWPALRDATSTGLIAVGSHTHSHRLLDRLDSDAVAEELDRSIALIGEHIGTAPDHFAYPKAVPGSPAAEIAVRLRFRSAALASNRVNRPGHADVHRLGRTPIQRSDSPAIFTAKVDGGMRLEGVLRSLAARQRLRGQSW